MSANVGTTLSLADIDYDCQSQDNSSDPNTVTVSLTDQAQQTLSNAIGVDQIDVFSSSTAEYDGGTFGGLRPIAMCLADLPDEVGPHDDYDPPKTFTVGMSKTWKNTDCGGGSGTWGWLCFDVTSGCNTNDIEDFLDDGFPRNVTLGSLKPPGDPHNFDDVAPPCPTPATRTATPPWRATSGVPHVRAPSSSRATHDAGQQRHALLHRH